MSVEQWMRLNPDASIEELRNAAIEITQAVLDEYGDAASSLACSLFDNVMELEGVNVPSAQVYTGVRTGAIEGTVHRVVGTVDGTAESLSAFLTAIETLAERETQLAAGMTIETNVERANKTKSGKYVRYARIPTGLDPCPWCAMLASRGFVYKSSEDAAAGSHHHCSCTIKPGVRGETQVDGYEPNYYKGVWKAGI